MHMIYYYRCTLQFRLIFQLPINNSVKIIEKAKRDSSILEYHVFRFLFLT